MMACKEYRRRSADIHTRKSGVLIMGLFNFVSGLLVGTYAGIYIAQQYNVPVLPDPGALVKKVQDWAEENKKRRND